VLIGSANATFAIAREEYDRVYRSLGMHPVFVDVATADDIENAVAEVARQGAQALDIPVDGLFHSNRVVTMRAALRHALPTIVGDRAVLEAGGLVSLSIDEAEIYPTFAYFLDKILRGAKPADLPIQQPTKFVLTINLRTAKALGLTIPPTLLQRADELIQ
jgi:putative ABC transport system substrate-binding protein